MQHSLFIIGSQISLFFLCISFKNMMAKKIIQINDVFYSLRISTVTDNLLRQLVNKLFIPTHNAILFAQLCRHTRHLLIIHQHTENESGCAVMQTRRRLFIIPQPASHYYQSFFFNPTT